MTGHTPYRRKPMRAGLWRYNHDGTYFDTTVTQNRCHLFGDVGEGTALLSAAGEQVDHYWRELESRYPQTELGEYVIMPNHFHGIILIRSKDALHLYDETLGDMMMWFNTMTTNAYIRGVKEHGWPRFQGILWQSGYYDHIIRNSKDLARVEEYIISNP